MTDDLDIEPIFESASFKCSPCRDCDIPGYLILFAVAPANALSNLQSEQIEEIGPLIARIEKAVAEATQAERVYILRFSEGSNQLHFHIFPRTAKLADEFRRYYPTSGDLNGETVYGWARVHYRTKVLSAAVRETAARIRDQLNILGNGATPSRGIRSRLVMAFKDTYGFERPERRDETRKFSLFIWVPGFLLHCARFLWGVEIVRFVARWLRTQPDHVEVHPVISDTYILLMTAGTCLLVCALGLGWIVPAGVAVSYALWRLFEDLGTTFHALVMRPVFSGRKARSEFRYLIATIVRAVEVWAALILIWSADRALLVGPAALVTPKFPTTLQVAYFVTTSITTVGYGDLVPNAAKPVALILAMATQFVSVAMITMLMGKALSLVAPRFGPVR